MRWANLLCCCLFFAFTVVGAITPLPAADLRPPIGAYPDDAGPSDPALAERDIEEYCYTQRRICRKICNLRFRDDFIGCPQTCESRVGRCMKTGCFNWREPEFLIAENFGGFQCRQ